MCVGLGLTFLGRSICQMSQTKLTISGPHPVLKFPEVKIPTRNEFIAFATIFKQLSIVDTTKNTTDACLCLLEVQQCTFGTLFSLSCYIKWKYHFSFLESFSLSLIISLIKHVIPPPHTHLTTSG